MSKSQPDVWSTNPARISSFIKLPVERRNDIQASSYTFPVCGLGWKYDITRNFRYEVSSMNPDTQERRSNFSVTFKSNQCQGMKCKNPLIAVKVSFDGLKEVQPLVHKSFRHSDISEDLDLGTYNEPFPHPGQTHLEISINFDANELLHFPVTSSPTLTRALALSLDGQVLIDTKFYLYSTRVGGVVGQPRAVYANAATLVETSTYFKDLLSDSQFQSGVLCGIYEDPPEVLEKLSPKSYDYESDSDLEDMPDSKNKAPSLSVGESVTQSRVFATTSTMGALPEAPPLAAPGPADRASFGPLSSAPASDSGQRSERKVQVHAYTISGTAHRTWKAYVYYVYSNEIQFRPLKSRNHIGWFGMPATACSPKSMYRFADYACLPDLKKLAKDKIREGLSECNIIEELFSRFTSKYDEIIEMEVAILLDHFRPVSNRFDATLELIVNGSKPHCYRTLAFTIKRLHGQDAAPVWKALDNRGIPTSPAGRPRTPTTKKKVKRSIV